MIRVPALVSRPPRSLVWRGGAAAAWAAGVLVATLALQLPGRPASGRPALGRDARRSADRRSCWRASAASCAAPRRRRGSSPSSSRCSCRRWRCIRRCSPFRLKRRNCSLPANTGRRRFVSGTICGSGLRTRSIRSTRCDRCRSSSPRRHVERRVRRCADDRSRVLRLVDDRSRHVPADVGGRAYGANGRLVDRFSESAGITTSPYFPSSCAWERVAEVSPFGSSGRQVLRAQPRHLRARPPDRRDRRPRDARLPDAAVHLVAEPVSRVAAAGPARRAPKACSAVTSSSSSTDGAARRSTARTPASGRCPIRCSSGWSSRASRSGTTSRATARLYRVYFLSDRGGIYALGYPVITWFGHCINLAELVDADRRAVCRARPGARSSTPLTSRTPASGRALLREVRSSFYRKLFLAFVAVAVVPVVDSGDRARGPTSPTQLRAGVEEAAARTVTVAQRLVEDYATLQQRGRRRAGARSTIRSWCWCDAPSIRTSTSFDRDASAGDERPRSVRVAACCRCGRPARSIKPILLDRMPTYVGERGGRRSELICSPRAPVRAGGREGIVTVPLTSRQQEIELQIDELDRRVLSRRCSSACSAPPSATGWRSASPIRSTA